MAVVLLSFLITEDNRIISGRVPTTVITFNAFMLTPSLDNFLENKKDNTPLTALGYLYCDNTLNLRIFKLIHTYPDGLYRIFHYTI